MKASTAPRRGQGLEARTGRRPAAAATIVLGALLVVAAAPPAMTAPPPPEQDWVRTEPPRPDCTSYDAFRQPFFGDTHVHTVYSADAALARVRSTPYEAYDFATGGTIGLPPYDAFDIPWRLATIDRPLDFVALTDHSEGLGEAVICLEPGYPGYNDPLCQDVRATFPNDYHPTNPLPQAFIDFFFALVSPTPARFTGVCGPVPAYADCMAEAAIVWQDIQDAAEAYYDRTAACTFTTFSAYEWSGQPAGNNLHRNVIFRNAEVPSLPISYYEKPKPEDLRAELKAQCIDAAGNCDVLAIPHNSNLAQDKMFDSRTADNAPITAEFAALRAELEPIMELTQVKQDSECRDGVAGTSDELCQYEKNTTANILSGKLANDSDFSQYAYARGGLKRGLFLERQTGVNPYPLGFVGSTDTHNATPGATSEEDFGLIGSFGITDSHPAFALADATQPSKVEQNPGGLAVVWAEENSRDAIFAAMRRRETYSTSGTRPIVRVFGGRVPEDLCTNGSLDFVAEGYDKGEPMGGNIGPELGKKSPRFAVWAQKDPGGLSTPLQRIQIVKGWIDKKTETHEVVYDVAGDPDNGAGVDLDTCAETGSGFDTLCAVWEDPDFDPAERAFYYARVVENPVCRWHKRLCNDLRTCSTLLQACSLDLQRRCTTNAECEAADPGSTCTESYPVVCVQDSDCDVFGAGTCGVAPAVDCDVPASVPAAAAECCDDANPWTIQERAVASPIFYHPGRVGLHNGKVRFHDDPGRDRLKLDLLLPIAPAELDPAANDLELSLRDDATPWTALIPAGTMEVKKPGAKYKYKDKTGSIAGITSLVVKINGKGTGRVKVKTGDIDLSGLDQQSQKLAVDLVAGSYSSTAEREWGYKSPRLGVLR